MLFIRIIALVICELFMWIIIFFAGIAQLVEHNLAMVRVASSNLVSRSKYGALVKRLYSGLQIRIVQFDSETRLQLKFAQVVKLVDTRDLKSLGTYTSVSVRLRPRAPLLTILEISPTKQKSRTIEICLKIVCSIQFTDQLWM